MGRKKVKCMKKIVMLVTLLSIGAASMARAETREDVQNRLDNATLVLHQIMSAPDRGIPEEVMEHAKCIAVVPHMIKGGFVFGAENGKGVATCRTANGWSAPDFFVITGGSWGLQIGVEGVDVVMIFQGDRGHAAPGYQPTSRWAETPPRQPAQWAATLPLIPIGI